MKEILAITKALADESRVRALLCLNEGEVCLCQIAEILGLAPSTTSKHMAILQQAGLVEARKDGRWVYYRHADPEQPGCAQHAVAWLRKYLDDDETVRTDSTKCLTDTVEDPDMCERPRRPKVMFLCTGNSCRSQMAEALLRKHAGHVFDIYSAGLEPTDIHPYTRRVLAEAGMDMTGQHSKSILDFLGKAHFAYLITVCSRAEERCPIFPGVSYRLYWPFEDPAALDSSEEDKLATFRKVRDAIAQRLVEWLEELSTSRNSPVVGVDFRLSPATPNGSESETMYREKER